MGDAEAGLVSWRDVGVVFAGGVGVGAVHVKDGGQAQGVGGIVGKMGDRSNSWEG